MSEEPVKTLWVTPTQLRGNKTFQESYGVTKLHLQNMLLWLQRQKAVEHKGNPEEAGRCILIIQDVLDVLDECEEKNFISQSRGKFKPLNNKQT